MVTRSGKISVSGTVLLVMAILYLFLPVYTASVENFTFTCSVVTMLLKGGFTHASFFQIVQYFLPMVLLITAGIFAMGGKLKYKYVVVGLCIFAIIAFIWMMVDLTLVKNLLNEIKFGNVNVKKGTGLWIIVDILVVLWAGVTVFLAKGRNTF